jgi:murein L,D-transpeptidase YcbB/YkuD
LLGFSMVKIVRNFLLTAVLSTTLLVAESNKTAVEKKAQVATKTVAKSSSVWVNGSSLSNLSKELIAQIKKDKTIASDLPFYKLYKSVLSDIKSGKPNSKKIGKLYSAYMNYLINGQINWNSFQSSINRLKKKYDYNVGWERAHPPYSAKSILKNAIAAGSFNNIFSKVEPKRFKYKQLKKYLIKFIDIKNSGGWGSAGSKTLKVGSSSKFVPNIRKHLKLVGDLGDCGSEMDSLVYDSCMAKALKRFRLRHGLGASSTIDKSTRRELSRSVSYYIKKIRLNMDRIKWIKRAEARVRIELNIPAFRLYVYDGKDLVTTMRVVTGKPDHPTPIFSDVMTTIVVNPYWRIPESIVRKEMLKKLIKNPYYYEKRGKYLYSGWGAKSKKIDPATVNWKKYLGNKKHIPYHFMQEPGNRNALGRIKFLFPNKYAVYIHDTPSKRLFFRQTRAFSHGCMRIQKPRELLKALSLYNKNVHVNSLMKKLGTTDNTHVGLSRKIPIDIVYLTSFVDDYGNLHFRNDIYGYDRLQLKSYGNNLVAKKSKKSKKSKKTKKQKSKTTKKKSPKKKSNIVEIGY